MGGCNEGVGGHREEILGGATQRGNDLLERSTNVTFSRNQKKRTRQWLKKEER